MAKRDLRLGTLSTQHLDGVPLDLAAKLLPSDTKYSLGLAAHIHLHARSQLRNADTHTPKATSSKPRISKMNLIALVGSLENTIKNLSLPPQKTEWGEYYSDTNYSSEAAMNKKKIIEGWLKKIKPKSIWDAGANDATFSRLGSQAGIPTLATDIDPIAIEHAYQQAKKGGDTHLLPLIIDLTNPSPAIGWGNTERDSFLSRTHVDVTLALAFIHHLCIANNLPLERVAQLFAEHSEYLIIEFVPKEDSNAQRLLAAREDIFPTYTKAGFEKAFEQFFTRVEKKSVGESLRTLYLLKRRT